MLGSEHFRNILRRNVKTDLRVVTLRVDNTLYFANARFLEDYIYDCAASDRPVQHVVLMCPAISAIDYSALESLEAIDAHLKNMYIKLHLSELKGPAMDQLEDGHCLEHLLGQVFLSQCDAFETVTK